MFIHVYSMLNLVSDWFTCALCYCFYWTAAAIKTTLKSSETVLIVWIL